MKPRLGSAIVETPEVLRALFDDVPAEEIARQTERVMAEIREEDRAEQE